MYREQDMIAVKHGKNVSLRKCIKPLFLVQPTQANAVCICTEEEVWVKDGIVGGWREREREQERERIGERESYL